jgi:dTMP kinase
LLEAVEKKQMKKGILIAIEGIDGAGKTTQAKILLAGLQKRGYPAILLHEPTSGKWGQKIKELASNGRHKTRPEEELELFYLDRVDDVKHNIAPFLHDKKVVIMDRYYFSNVAYQSERGLNPNQIEEKNTKIAPIPDITIILDLEPEVSLERIIQKRNGTPNHFERKGKLDRVRQAFLKQFGNRINVKVIDGDDSNSIENVASEIWRIVEPKIKEAEEENRG